MSGVTLLSVAALVLVDVSVADAAALAPRVAAVSAVPAAGKPKVEKVVSRPDVVSARVTARAQGSRVEVEALRDATSTTWVNPDGTLTTEAHGGPIRFHDPADPKGAWRDVDLTMATVPGGTVAPKGHPLGLSLAGASKGAGGVAKGASHTDVVVARQGKGKRGQDRDVALGWGGSLGTPVLSGTSATYRDVEPGVDLVVDARRTGFETHLVIDSAQALAGLKAAAADGVVSWRVPVRTKGLTARAEKDGSVSFVDADGQVVSFIPAPVAWDDVVDPRSGNRVAESAVAMTLTRQGAGRAVVTLTPDQDWLFSPDRVFPVTIDPSYASGKMTTVSDTYVSSAYPSSNYRSATTLRVGTYNGGGDKQRSFLKFDFSGYKNLDIVSGTLNLYESWSYSCTAKPFYVYSSGATDGSVTWNTQPGVGSQHGSLTVAKGYSSSCGADWVKVPITSLVDYWSNNAYSTGWLRLSASETDSYGWKKFSSLQTTQDPHITFTYNRKPNAAGTPTLGGTADGANSYTIPGTSTVQQWTRDSTPKFYSSAYDPDASQVQVKFEVHTSTTVSSSTLVTSCYSAWVSSTAQASCSAGTALGENKTYYVRAAVQDDRGLWNGTWSPWRTFYTEWTAPPAPKVSCDNGYGDGTWTDADPAGTVTCQVTAAGVSGTYQAPAYLDMAVDGGVQQRWNITPTNDWSVVHKTFSFAPTARGYHEIKVTGISRSLVSSPQTVTGFGWGAASMTSPVTATASTGKVKVTAGGPPKGSATTVTAKTQWRVAGSGNEATGWTDAASGPVTVTPSGTAAAAYTGVFDLTTAAREAGASVDVPKRTPVRLDVQVCFTYTGTSTSVQCTWSQSPVTVTRLPHAFGAGYPTADAGVGQLALYTGEVAVDATDVSVPGYSGDITISRSHTSFAGDQTVAGWPSNAVTGVFGPGWTANLEGGAAGLAGLQVVDQTGIDGSIAFVDADGEPLVYANPAGTRTYPTSGTVTYQPATQDTIDAAVKLTVAGTGTAMRLTLTEDDGTTTSWAPLATPSTSGTTWRPETISEPGQAGKTTFGADPTGRVIRIVAPVPDGMPGTSCPTSGTLVKGCRALDITYATSTTATSSTPGDITGQVKQVSSWLWNPATSAMTPTTVATYTYDASGRLVTQRDPRTGLGTDYTWDGSSTRIASVRQNTLAATKLAYSSGKLTQVSREAPVAGQADVTIARYGYAVPTSGTGLPDLTSDTSTDPVRSGYQNSNPVTGYAVFGQDYTGPVSGTGVDWSYADLSYVDELGYTVNTASYGAGAWQVTSTDYDTTTNNVVRQLDASATQTAATANPALTPAQVDALSTQTIYNEQVKDAAGTIVLPAGSRVVDSYGPARPVVLADGSDVIARPHTHTDYDQGAPNGGINPATGQRYSLPTTVTAGAATGIGADVETVSVSTTGYTKINASDPAEGDGWALGAATTSSTWTNTTSNTGAITATTRYDTLGRAIEKRQPMSNGTDAGTIRTAYYTVAAQAAPNAACGAHPEWAGLTCRAYPAAAPSQGPTLPDETTTAYTMWLQPATVVETSGTASRTTATSYDTAGRTISSTVTASGLTGSTARPGSYTKYRTDNGLTDYTGPLNTAGTDAEATGRTSYSYDRWGRATVVTGDAGPVSTTYDAAGRVASVTDAKGTRSYGYDGAGERRGLVTSLTVSRPGTGGALTYTASYDADGKLTRQGIPGGLTQVTSYDDGGEPVGLSYLGQVTPVTVSTDPDTGETIYTPGTPVQDQPWMSWSTTNDITGRARLQATGTGAAFDDGTGVPTIDDVQPWTADAVGQASSYAREYRYDPAGRLTYARSADATPDPATGTQVPTCTERAYTFDINGRRTSLATTAHPDGDCTSTASSPTPSTTSTISTTGWDSADRPTTSRDGTGTYSYDLFGRQTTLPAADAPNPANGDITLGYYDDDLPRAISQGDTSTTFTLDAAGRRSTQTSTTTPAGTTTTVRRYTDDGDNPAWIETTPPGASAPAVTRFTESIGGDLSATISADGTTSLSLADPHGDTVTTVPIAANQTSTTCAVAITGWASYDEYGNPATTGGSAIDQVDGPLGYGWLGAKQRSTSAESAGLTLMGVRLYNAARGLFTSVDPEPGGSATAFGYPFDPVNQYDLSGQWWGWAKTLRRIASVAGLAAGVACVVATAGICGVAGAVALGASFVYHSHAVATRRQSWASGLRSFGFDAALNFIPGARFVRGGFRYSRLVGRHAGSRLLTHASSYAGRHAARAGARNFGRSVWHGVRHGANQYRANWALHPYRSVIRHTYNGYVARRGWDW